MAGWQLLGMEIIERRSFSTAIEEKTVKIMVWFVADGSGWRALLETSKDALDSEERQFS